MKKILTSIAMALLLVGCAKQYDDTAIKTQIADLDRRVTALESSVEALRSAIGEGVFVAKVQELADPETGKTIGVTVTYSNGDVKYFEITPKVDYAGPVVSIIKNGAGALVWAVDGVAIKDANGKDVTVYQTPVFTIDGDGNLLVSIDGSDPVVLGQVQNEGATLVDGIFTDIKVLEDKIVLTLSDNSIVNIPFAETFKISIENNDIVYDKIRQVIEIPYTVSAKTAGTVVDVMGYDPYYFQVEVTEEKILVTPMADDAAATMMVVADSKVGLVSIVKLSVSNEMVMIVDPEPEDFWEDYVIDSDGGTIVANIVSNVEIDAIPREGDEEWITIVETKAMNAHTITFTVAPNTSKDYRTGRINFYKKGTDRSIHSIYVRQNGLGPKNLSKNGTANCYIVTAAGEYKFKAVKGNSDESVGTVAKAEILWETWNNQETVTVNSVIKDVDFDDNYIYFATPETLKPGNALIAAKDASDVILWSWHIWIPKDAITESVDNHYSVKSVMDRNLGALVSVPAEGVAPVESFGMLYEWGRKDPFPGLGVTSGAGAITVAGIAMTKELAPFTVEQTIQNPTVYVRKNDTSKDWLPAGTDAAFISSLWGETEKTLYDPCPVGYMLPQRNTSCGFWNDEMNTKDYFVLDSDNCKYTVGTLLFPISGYIDEGSENQKKAGTRTIVWSARWDSGTDNGYGMYGYTDDGIKFKRTGVVRTRGGSVRCVAEASAE